MHLADAPLVKESLRRTLHELTPDACVRGQPGVVKFAHYAEALPHWIEHDYGNFTEASAEKLHRCLWEIGLGNG